MRTALALTTILGMAMLAVHIVAKRQPDPKEVEQYSQHFKTNERWQGRVAADFEIKTLDGETFKLADHVGREVVILNFFTTWCGPCRAEMPELQRFAGEVKGKPIRVIGIDVEEKRETVESFLRELKITLPVALDEPGDVVKKYGIDSYPTTVVIGPDGRIPLYQVGPIMNADVAFDAVLKPGLAAIASATGISREGYLLASAPEVRDTSTKAVDLEGRAEQIAKAMVCPCGCADKVAPCHCSTAKAIKKRLAAGLPADRTNADVIRALDREFCVKDKP
jgi:thiol-disulfide isomerase/thioredoxin